MKDNIEATDPVKTATVPAVNCETPCYGTPLSEIKDPDLLRSMVDQLWSLLDHIDTLDDAARDNDLFFRNTTRAYQKKRFKVLESDGYSLFAPVA